MPGCRMSQVRARPRNRGLIDATGKNPFPSTFPFRSFALTAMTITISTGSLLCTKDKTLCTVCHLSWNLLQVTIAGWGSMTLAGLIAKRGGGTEEESSAHQKVPIELRPFCSTAICGGQVTLSYTAPESNLWRYGVQSTEYKREDLFMDNHPDHV